MCVIWGIPYLLIKVAVAELTPAVLVLCRTGLAAVLLLPVAVARGELRPVLRRWRPLLGYTVAELVVPWFLLATAERRLSSSLTGLLVAAVPLVGVVLGLLAGSREPLGARRLAGLLLGLAGVASLVGLDVGGSDLLAVAAVAVVAVCYALGPLILSRSLSDLPALGVVAASIALTAVGYAPVGIAQLPARMPGADVVAAAAVLAVVCTAVAFPLFFGLIAEAGPVRATVITYVNPAVAVALGVAFLHEPFTLGIAVGFALVLTGSILATRRAPTAALAGQAPRAAPASDR
jgi:drug/metabolite transporter (DMT)-like permease